jgi:hypothetical protein
VDWIHFTEGTDQWQLIVNTAMKLSFCEWGRIFGGSGASTGLQSHCRLKLCICIQMFITLQTEVAVSCCLLIVLCVCICACVRACARARARVCKSEATQNDIYNIIKLNYDLMFKIVVDFLKSLKN